MAKRFLKRFMPQQSKLMENRTFRFFNQWLHKADVWHFNRRYASRAMLIGMFFAFVPLPTQMIMACIGCILVRANLPLAIACVWTTNPLTMGPVFYGCYRLGAFLMNEKIALVKGSLQTDWLATHFHAIILPLLLGSMICGVIFAALGYTLVDVLWRWHTVKRWHRRQIRQRKRTDPNHS